MQFSRLLGAVGRTLIAAGVLTLMFVAYQLWGTGLLTAQAQAELEEDFEAILAEVEEGGLLALASGGANPTPTPGPSATAPPTDSDDPSPTPIPEATPEGPSADQIEALQRLAELLYPPSGSVIARLIIPEIDLDERVVSGVGVEDLRKGPGHYRSTVLPGMPGNAAIAGHRTTWGAPFNRLDELEPGDEIQAITVQGRFTYRVVEQPSGKGWFVVPPNRIDVLDQDFVDHPNRITLTACHPKYTARQRIIVVAELIGSPAEYIERPRSVMTMDGLASEDLDEPATDPTATPTSEAGATATPTSDAAPDPTATVAAGGTSSPPEPPAADSSVTEPPGPLFSAEDFGEGLNGDRSGLIPAAFWGLAAGSIWLAAGFWGSRWRKWPAYGMGILPFLPTLFVCFFHIDRALPSY